MTKGDENLQAALRALTERADAMKPRVVVLNFEVERLQEMFPDVDRRELLDKAQMALRGIKTFWE